MSPRKRKQPESHRILVLFHGSQYSVLKGHPTVEPERPIPDADGLWVGEWDIEHEVYLWHPATAYELAVAGLIHESNYRELEARVVELELRLTALEQSHAD